MSKQNEHDVYLIPPNFIEGGTVFGGMLKLRNVIEAGIIALIIGYRIIKQLNDQLEKKGKIIVAGKISARYFYENVYL